MITETEVLKKLSFCLRKDNLRILNNKEALNEYEMRDVVKKHIEKSYDAEIVENNQWLQKCANKLQMIDEELMADE